MQAQHGKELFSKSSSDEDLSDSNDVQSLTGKGQAFSVSGKEEAIRARTQAPRRKNLSFQTRFGMLPTANNRANNSNTTGLDTQFEYHHIFTTFAHHKLPENLEQLRSIISEVLTDMSSLRSGTLNPLSQFNLMVNSWYTKRNDNHDSTSIFDENIGEDRLSIQSTYDVNIHNPHHTGSLAPNCEVLDSPSLSDDELKASYTILTKGINELRVQLSTNKTLLSVDKKGQTFNTNIAEVLAANIIISINDIELNKWAVDNKFARCWYCQDLCNCSVLKVAIKKAIHKSPHDVQQRHLFCYKDDGQKISFCGMCPHTRPAMC